MDTLFDSICNSTPGGCDGAGVWLGAILTLLVLSYLIKDTFLSRLAQSLLVGTAIGYGSAVILRSVIWDSLLAPLISDTPTLWGNTWPLFVPLGLGLLLLTKLLPNWGRLGNISLGYLFGVGAALSIGGALNGALAPQLSATIVSLSPELGLSNWFNNLVLIIGTFGALLAFRFTARLNSRLLRAYSNVAIAWGRVGRGFIMIAFGAILANVLAARISALAGQLYFLFHDWLGIIK